MRRGLFLVLPLMPRTSRGEKQPGVTSITPASESTHCPFPSSSAMFIGGTATGAVSSGSEGFGEALRSGSLSCLVAVHFGGGQDPSQDEQRGLPGLP
jgi:hypothetical protein